MKIHASDGKLLQAQVVYSGKAFSTVAVQQTASDQPANESERHGTKGKPAHPKATPTHPKATPTHRQTRYWTCGLAACSIFAMLAAVGLFVLLYSAANPKDAYVGECEIKILPDERQDAGYGEHMTADEESSIETFDVPEINANNPATVLYDFSNEITVYLDRAVDVCFVMTMDTKQVIPPRSLLEAFIRFKRGEFSLDMDTVRETMHVQMPPISDMAPFGLHAMILCEDRPSYWLVKQGTPALRKRSVSSSEHRVTYYNGLHLVDLTVLMDSD